MPAEFRNASPCNDASFRPKFERKAVFLGADWAGVRIPQSSARFTGASTRCAAMSRWRALASTRRLALTPVGHCRSWCKKSGWEGKPAPF